MLDKGTHGSSVQPMPKRLEQPHLAGRKALGQSLSLPPVSSPQPPASRPPVSFPGILPGAGNGTSTAPPAPTELPLDKLRASFYAFKEKVTSGSKSDGLDDYRS